MRLVCLLHLQYHHRGQLALTLPWVILHAEAAQHKSFDLLVLVMLHSMGDPWRKSAVGAVKRKFGHELFNGGTIAEAVSGVQVILSPGTFKGHFCNACQGLSNESSLLSLQAEMGDLFASFLSLAGSLAAATGEVVRRAGSHMYLELFLAYQDAYFRQVEVLLLSMQLRCCKSVSHAFFPLLPPLVGGAPRPAQPFGLPAPGSC